MSKKIKPVNDVNVNADNVFGTAEKIVPLTQAAFSAWNSAALRVMHTLFDWGSLKLRASMIGHPLEIVDLEELFHRDSEAPADTKCAVCGQAVEAWIALVIDQNTGDIVTDRWTGKPLERGMFIARKQKSGELATEAGCPKHLDFLRTVTVRGENKRVPAQSFAQATDKVNAINDTFAKEKALRQQYNEEHAFNRERSGTGGRGMTFGDARVGTGDTGDSKARPRGESKRRHAAHLPEWDGKGM